MSRIGSQDMSNPKMKPCPTCKTDEDLSVYSYDHGWKHVECDKCFYLGPGEGSIKQAIIQHNARQEIAETLSDAKATQ